MAAQINATSRFSSVVINLAGGVLPRTIYAEHTTGGVTDQINIHLKGARLPVVEQERENLEALQAIYASAAGFQRADGSALAVRISGTILGPVTTPAQLETFGAFNPLVAGWPERYAAKLRADGDVVAGGRVPIRFAGWEGGRVVPDTIEASHSGAGPVGMHASLEYYNAASFPVISGQIRVESEGCDPADCLWQGLVSWQHKGQWGWFIGLATEFLGWNTSWNPGGYVYPWSSYRYGIVLRIEWDGSVNLLHCGQTDGTEGTQGGINPYLIPSAAGSWAIPQTGVGGVRLPSASDFGGNARRRNGAFWLETSRMPGPSVPVGFSLRSYGRFFDVIHNGDHVARWTWDPAWWPFRAGRTRGTSYVLRGNAGNLWWRDGALVVPAVRFYAYDLSAGGSRAAAPSKFI